MLVLEMYKVLVMLLLARFLYTKISSEKLLESLVRVGRLLLLLPVHFLQPLQAIYALVKKYSKFLAEEKENTKKQG